MKKNELNKNVILNEDAVKNIHCDEITAVINSNDSPKAMMNKLDDYHGSDIAEVISTFSVLNRRKFYRVCSLEMLAEIFEYLDEKQALTKSRQGSISGKWISTRLRSLYRSLTLIQR